MFLPLTDSLLMGDPSPPATRASAAAASSRSGRRSLTPSPAKPTSTSPTRPSASTATTGKGSPGRGRRRCSAPLRTPATLTDPFPPGCRSPAPIPGFCRPDCPILTAAILPPVSMPWLRRSAGLPAVASDYLQRPESTCSISPAPAAKAPCRLNRHAPESPWHRPCTGIVPGRGACGPRIGKEVLCELRNRTVTQRDRWSGAAHLGLRRRQGRGGQVGRHRQPRRCPGPGGETLHSARR